MPTELITVVVLGAFALLFVGAYAMQKNNARELEKDQQKLRKDTESLWAELSRRTGMKLLTKSPYGLALHGVLDGTPVWFAERAYIDGRDAMWGLRAELPSNDLTLMVLPTPPEGREKPGGFAHVVPTGDEDFDLMYQLQADDAVTAFHAMGRAARQALMLLAPATLIVRNGTLTLTFSFDQTELDDPHIVAALELVRAMALPTKPRDHAVN